MKSKLYYCCCVFLVTALSACNSPTPTKSEKPSDARKTMTIEDVKVPVRENKEVRPSPNASVSQTIGKTFVQLDYGRPGVKGRKIFGGLEEFGKVWRVGANEATTFLATKDVLVNGQKLPKGVYAFFVIPTEQEWTVILNRNADQWGSFSYNKGLDQLRLSVKPETGTSQEWLTFSFENLTEQSAKMVLSWDTVRLPLTLEAVKSDTK